MQKVFSPGQDIPSRRELANQLKINLNTVQRAYKEMEEQQLIYTEEICRCITKDETILKSKNNNWSSRTVFINSTNRLMPHCPAMELVQQKYEEAEQ